MEPVQPAAPVDVRRIDSETHRRTLGRLASSSFLQDPAWAAVKPEWRAESVGWFRGGAAEPYAAALVLHRPLPRLKRTLAYLPEGPALPWDDADRSRSSLQALAAYLRGQGAFAIRIGPPVVTRRWSAQQVKDGIADPAVRRLGDVAPLERNPTGARAVSTLRELGWRPQQVEGGFAAGQPQFNFWVPLDRPEEEILAGMNQLWRRNIKKAAKVGVEVTSASGARRRRAARAFHALYAETAERDHFTPRPVGYFATMLRALGAEDPGRIRLYLAHHEGDLVAATIAIRVGGHAWYSYGASSTAKREVRGSNAVQWQMMRDMRRGRRRGLRPARHHRHPRRRRPARRPDPVQGRHRRRGRRVRRRVGPARSTALLYTAFDLYMSGGADAP